MVTDPAKRAVEIMAKSAANLKQALPNAVKDGALQAKKAVEAERDKVASSGKLRNVGKSGGKLGVGFDLNLTGDTPSATVKARGPWQIIERDTDAHTIRPKGKKKKALRLPNGGVRRSVPHPGTKGKHPFERGYKAAGPKVHSTMATRSIKAVGDAWS